VSVGFGLRVSVAQKIVVNVKSEVRNEIFETSNGFETKEIVKNANSEGGSNQPIQRRYGLASLEISDDKRELVDSNQWKNGGKKSDKVPKKNKVLLAGNSKNNGNKLAGGRRHKISLSVTSYE